MLSSALFSIFQIRVLFFETIFLDVFTCVWEEADFLDTATEMVLFSRYFALFSLSSLFLSHKRSLQKYVEYLTGKQMYLSRNVTKEKSRLQGEAEDSSLTCAFK
jgi:hypothetical protein